MWGGELDLKECSNPEALAAVQMGHASKTEDLRWSPSRVQRADTELDPSRITKLIDKEFVWFDPQRGFCTDADNLKQSGIDKAFPYIFAAAMTAMSFGAGSTLAATVSSAAGGGTTGAMAVGATGAFISNASLQLAANGKINFGQLLRSTLAGGATAGLLDVTGLNSVPEGATLGQRLMNYTGRATLQGAIQSVMGGKFRDGFVNSMMGSVAAEVSQQLNSHIAQLEGNGSLSASEASAMRLLSRATGSALRIAGSADPAAGFASDFLGGLMHDGLAAHQPNTDAAGSAPPADPLGEFIAGNDQQRGMRQAVADLLDQTLDNAESPNNRTLLAAADSSFLPESVGRSIDFGRGFVEGGGISILQSGAALWSLASHPGQFIEGVQALLTSADARGQLAQEVLRGVQTDIQMFRDAYDAGDMRVAGQQFGKLTTDLAQMVGGVEALVRMAPSLARGVGRGANAVAGVFEDTIRRSSGGSRGLGAQRGSVGGSTVSSGRSVGFDTSNLQSKLEGYLLDAAHPQNQTKAIWFKEALGFDKGNWQELGSQIRFNEATATATKSTNYGQTFEQIIPINGVNGKTIDVTFVFIKDNVRTVRLVTGIPTKK